MSSYAVQIIIGSQTIPLESITKFSYVTDIRNMYSGAQVLIRDLCEQLYNNVSTGMDAQVIFGSENKTYTNNMKVLDFVKVPGNQQDASDALTVNLVSSWYFADRVGSLAYKGTVSNIVKKIYDNLISPEGIQYSGEDSDDHSTVRYLAGDRFQGFLQKITHYARKNGTPMFLYSDDRGNLNFRSFSTMGDASPAITLIPDSMTMIQDGGITPDPGTLYMRAVDFSFQSNCSNSTSKHNYYFTSNNFINDDDFADGVQLSNLENDNLQSKSPTPARTTYYNWSFTPSDAYGLALNDFFSKNMSTYSLVAVFKELSLDLVELGKTVKVKLPFTPVLDSQGNKVNLGEGTYIVSHIEYERVGVDYQTKVQLVQYDG